MIKTTLVRRHWWRYIKSAGCHLLQHFRTLFSGLSKSLEHLYFSRWFWYGCKMVKTFHDREFNWIFENYNLGLFLRKCKQAPWKGLCEIHIRRGGDSIVVRYHPPPGVSANILCIVWRPVDHTKELFWKNCCASFSSTCGYFTKKSEIQLKRPTHAWNARPSAHICQQFFRRVIKSKGP